MDIAEPIRFFAGIALMLVAAALLWRARGTSGFNQKRQAGVLALAGGGLLVAFGLGYISWSSGLLG